LKYLIKNIIIAATLLTFSTQTLLSEYAGSETYRGEGSIAPDSERPGLSTAEIDQLVVHAMEKFKVPGMGVGIIKDGKVIHAKGYGVRDVTQKGKVDEKTLFSIASTGKSFTAVALALLVDEGKINWNDKVIDYISDFRLNDPWVTREFTIRDLLIHNSGLGLGAGDLMFVPSEGFSREEIIRNLRHLRPVSSFRAEYAYDNLLYIVAGEVIAVVSGMPYEKFIDNRILKSLGMENCTANPKRLKRYRNLAQPHQYREDKLQKIERSVKLGVQDLTAAAGGMLCSVKSILKWHNMHLSKGKLPGGENFLSEKQQAELMTAQTIIKPGGLGKIWDESNFSAYGLGWFLEDFHGFKMIQHGGGLPGMTSLNAMLPELGLGVVIYTNQQAGMDRYAILYQILESYITDKKTDWVSKLYESLQKRRAEAAKPVPNLAQSTYTVLGKLDRYTGTYRDSWFEDVEITQRKEGLYFTSLRSARLKGRMFPYKSDLFIVRWDDRALDADAYVKFTTGYDGNPEVITMKAVSPLTDFSFNFHDLNFIRVQQTENKVK